MEGQVGNVLRIGTMELKFLVDETKGTGDVVMFEFSVPPNARVPAAHFHRETRRRWRRCSVRARPPGS